MQFSQMKIFYIEHIDNRLIVTDFENDYEVKVNPEGKFYFEGDDYFNYTEYIHYLNGCDSIESMMDAAADADFRIIDDPKNRSRARYKFGREIARTRKELGISQHELAERTGLKPVNLISIELGRYSVSFDNMNNIAKALGKEIHLG